MVTSVVEIPVTSQNQTFKTTLNQIVYTMTLRWNKVADSWSLDIADSSGNPIVSAIALVTGCDLLGQFSYLNFGGAMVTYTDGDIYTPPSSSNLGVNGGGHLVFAIP